MARSSLRHAREFYGVDAAGETPYMHGEIGADSGSPIGPTLPTADYLCGPGGWTDEGAWSISGVYGPCKIVTNNGKFYLCYSGHTASTANEPGVGSGWQNNWYEIQNPAGVLSVPKPTPGMVREHDAVAAAIAAEEARDKVAEQAALADMLRQLETHQAELLAAQQAQDAAREAQALEAMRQAQAAALAALETHTGELHEMYQVPPPGSPYPRFAWPHIPDNVDSLTKSEAREWLAQNVYPDEWEAAAKHQLGDYTAVQLRDMITGAMPAPVIHKEPTLAAPTEPTAPLPVPVNVPPLAGIADGTAMDQFMVMDKDQVLDWMIHNWYADNELIRPVLSGYSYEELIAMIAEKGGV